MTRQRKITPKATVHSLLFAVIAVAVGGILHFSVLAPFFKSTTRDAVDDIRQSQASTMKR